MKKVMYVEKYAYDFAYIVARDGGDGNLYFWGAYDTEAECLEVVSQLPRATYLATENVAR